MDLIKKAAGIAKMKVEGAMQRTPLEKALFNVTSNLENIPAHSHMEMIAEESHHFDEAKMIMKWVTKKLRKNVNKRVIIRTLDLVRFLLKNGSMKIVHEIRDEKYLIKSLQNILANDDEYQALEISKNIILKFKKVTKKSKDIIELLDDDEKLEEERESAATLRQRYKGSGSGVGSGGYGGGGGNSYGGYGSGGGGNEGFGSKNNRKKKRKKSKGGSGMEGFGGGSYAGYGSGGGKTRSKANKYYSGGGGKKYTGGGSTGENYDDYSGKTGSLREKLGIQTKKKKENKEVLKKPEKPAFTKKDNDETDLIGGGISEKKQNLFLAAPPSKGKKAKFLPPPPAKGNRNTAQNNNLDEEDLFGELEEATPQTSHNTNQQTSNNDEDLLGEFADLTLGTGTTTTNNTNTGGGILGMNPGTVNTSQNFGFIHNTGTNNTNNGISTNNNNGNNFGFIQTGAGNNGMVNTGQTHNTQNQGFGQNNISYQPKNLISYETPKAKNDLDFGAFEKAQTSEEKKIYSNFTKDEAALFDLSSLKVEKKQAPKQPTYTPSPDYNMGFGNLGMNSSNNQQRQGNNQGGNMMNFNFV